MPRGRVVFKFCEWKIEKCEWKGVCETGAQLPRGSVAAGKGAWTECGGPHCAAGRAGRGGSHGPVFQRRL